MPCIALYCRGCPAAHLLSSQPTCALCIFWGLLRAHHHREWYLRWPRIQAKEGAENKASHAPPPSPRGPLPRAARAQNYSHTYTSPWLAGHLGYGGGGGAWNELHTATASRGYGANQHAVAQAPRGGAGRPEPRKGPPCRTQAKLQRRGLRPLAPQSPSLDRTILKALPIDTTGASHQKAGMRHIEHGGPLHSDCPGRS